jgi:hypothetical protein
MLELFLNAFFIFIRLPNAENPMTMTYDDPQLAEKFKTITDLVVNMLHPCINFRPNLEQVLKVKDKWALRFFEPVEKRAFKSEIETLIIEKNLNDKFKFYEHFMRNKLEIHKLEKKIEN